MLCSCGLEAVLKRFDTFEYYYCGECKKEVGLEEKPLGEQIREHLIAEDKWLEEFKAKVRALYEDKRVQTTSAGDWLKEYSEWKKKNAKDFTTAK